LASGTPLNFEIDRNLKSIVTLCKLFDSTGTEILVNKCMQFTVGNSFIAEIELTELELLPAATYKF
jgi:hypothetical protein